MGQSWSGMERYLGEGDGRMVEVELVVVKLVAEDAGAVTVEVIKIETEVVTVIAGGAGEGMEVTVTVA